MFGNKAESQANSFNRLDKTRSRIFGAILGLMIMSGININRTDDAELASDINENRGRMGEVFNLETAEAVPLINLDEAIPENPEVAMNE